MLNQTFSVKNLSSLLRRGDFGKYNLQKTNKQYIKVIQTIADSINGKNYFDKDFKCRSVNNKFVYEANSFHNTLVLRKLDDNIKRLYKLKQADRISIVDKIVCILQDKSPMWVTRIDIKNFYETIDRDSIVAKLTSDNLLSYQSKVILNEVFSRIGGASPTGLPRGLSLSASLSELVMRRFDRFVSQLNGVYFYSRETYGVRLDIRTFMTILQPWPANPAFIIPPPFTM